MDEDVNRRLHESPVPAAHREEAEAHAHVEPLAEPAAPGQSRVLLLPLRAPSCTGDTRMQRDDAYRARSQTHGANVFCAIYDWMFESGFLYLTWINKSSITCRPSK